VQSLCRRCASTVLVMWTGYQIAVLAICGLSCLLPALVRFILFAHCINPFNPVWIFPGTP